MLAFKNYRRVQKLNPSVLCLDDLKRVCQELYELRESALMYEQRYYENLRRHLPEDGPEAKANKDRALAEDVKDLLLNLLISITIEGSAGELFTIIPGTDLDTVFSLGNLPAKISRIRFDNFAQYEVFTKKALNYRFDVELDFTDSEVWNLANVQKPNATRIEVGGLDETWVLGVVEKLKQSLERKPVLASGFMHKYIKYDLALWIVGIPSVFLCLNWASKFDFLSRFTIPVGLASIGYLIVGLFLLIIFRLFYNYVKWLFPYLELKEQAKTLQSVQRGVAIFVVLGIVTGWLSLLASFIATWTSLRG
jgi:hypothetical protein